MKIYFYLGVGIIITLIVTLFGYSAYLNSRGENQIAERMSNHHLPLTGVKVQERTLMPVVELDLVNLYSNDMTDVVALESGRVIQLFVEKNSHVDRGNPIIKLLDEDIPLKIRQTDSDIFEAEAQLVKARNTYNRYSQLLENNAISLERFDEAEAAYKAAQARLANFEAQREQLLIRQSREIINSPIDGEVLNLYQTVGAYVKAGTPVALVGDFSNLNFTSSLKDIYTKRLYVGREFDLTVREGEGLQKSYGANFSSGNLGENQVFRARVEKITPDLSEPASIRQVVWSVDNRVGLLEPGAYSKICLHSNLSHKCLSVPVDAFINENKTQVAVMVDGRLAIRNVETGITDGKYIEVKSGLQAGDIVITSDTEGIEEGTQIDIVLEDN
ncbi:efflux RND transporter periplasmic adaptor subunit [Anaerovibrio lipolyticus]|uniref:efflux RND transporter periplasmic adaptor subunit n=1 Tax=Anaerovibrio lipolyticus TaxID=82374 RepID=UPI0026EE497C|nr:efflux RND transporter periplasmic adaptor subunit [Anaerovibrio lipolyticus]MBE6105648.1 efflux RND transporter periplasmic adaptor subunit [Anaerovibrio lipolyticus]